MDIRYLQSLRLTSASIDEALKHAPAQSKQFIALVRIQTSVMWLIDAEKTGRDPDVIVSDSPYHFGPKRDNV